MRHRYQSALDYLYSFTDYGKQSGYSYRPDRYDLKRVDRLLALLGNPHHAFQAVHVAGTKGKGSTVAMIGSILSKAGYHTGLYTSPHLHTFRERIQLDGELISREQVVAGVDRLRAIAPQVPEITTFELITILAFHHFATALPRPSLAQPSQSNEAEMTNATLAVLEVGMGGRLDATNIVTPLVSVITPISYDHVMYLGDTLRAIATEKAGIIKPGVPVVSAPQPLEAQQAIERIAAQRGAALTVVGRDWQWKGIRAGTSGQQFAAWPASDSARAPVYSLPLLGQHQQVNAATALATVARLCDAGIDIPDTAVRAGLESVRWPGRLEVLGRRPWVIADGAHNGDSMQKLCVAIRELFPHRKMILVFGSSADKDIDGMLDAILPIVDHVLVTQADHPRAAAPRLLAERIAARGKRAETVAVDQVLDRALRMAGEGDLICATGSLFLVANLRAAWFEHEHLTPPPSDAE